MGDSRSSQERGPQALITSLVFTALALAIVILRLVTRLLIVKNFGPEDYLIVISMASSIALAVLICIEFQHGEGHHIDTIAASDLIALLKAFYGSLIAYQLALCLTKLSLLLQFYRVFVGPRMRLAIFIMMGVTTAYGFWSVLSNAFLCTPVAYFWDTGIAGGHCMSMQAVWFANASINIVTDVLIFALPMPALKQLQLRRRQKLCLMGVFALGGFVCLVSILRLRALYVVSVSHDVTWDNGAAAYWSCVEVNVGIICATLPTLKAFISRFFPKFLQNSSRGGTVGSHRSRPLRTSNFGLKTGTATHDTVVLKSNADGAMHYEMQKEPTFLSGLDEDDLEDGNIRVVTIVRQEARELSDEDSIDSMPDRVNSGRGAVQTVFGGNLR